MGTLDLLMICGNIKQRIIETLVEVSGSEPLTSCMPCKRSPS